MVFSSLTFLYAYLPVVLAVYFLTPAKFRNLVLFLVSLFFYGWGEPIYVLLMLFSIGFNWYFGLKIAEKGPGTPEAKKYLIYDIVLNLALLGFFKYTDFLIENLNALGLKFLKPLKLGLPIGISFYTFQAMSYPIDLYWNKTKVQKSPVNFGAYVTMFPQLIAGPIVRYVDVARQLRKRTYSLDKFYAGILRFTQGLCKKVLLANSAGAVWTSINSLSQSQSSVLTAWIGAAAYTFQIYFDFSGYSDMAIGLGKMLGFDFLENFNYPYISDSITEFWRRWHMSLSYWFRDYVYIPLGGNRKGKGRQILNIMIVWLLTGLWHGASWNFVIWGISYGILLIIEKLFLLKQLEKAPKWVRHVYTMFFVTVLWVLFDRTDLSEAGRYILNMFGGAESFVNGTTLFYLRDNFILLVCCALCATPLVKSTFNQLTEKYSKVEYAVPALTLIGLLLSTAFIVDASYNPFLYFRF